jgi:hypothetical protein
MEQDRKEKVQEQEEVLEIVKAVMKTLIIQDP